MKKIFLTLCLTSLVSCNGIFSSPSNSKDDASPDPGPSVPSKPDNPTNNEPEPTPEPTPVPSPAPEPPSCDKICVKDSSIIKSDLNGYSYLAFANFGYRGVGRCRGHALLTQKMSVLAKFDSKISCDTSTTSCINRLKNGIDKIINFETFTFSGVESLYELSQIPELKEYMINHVRSVSHRYTASPVKIQNSRFKKRSLQVFYELEKRTNNGQLPYVGVIGRQTGSHALLIYKTAFIGPKDVLCVRDPNIVLRDAEDCESYVFVEDGGVYYKRYDRTADLMTKFELTNDEDRRIRIYTNKLYKQCLVDSKVNGLCK